MQACCVGVKHIGKDSQRFLRDRWEVHNGVHRGDRQKALRALRVKRSAPHYTPFILLCRTSVSTDHRKSACNAQGQLMIRPIRLYHPSQEGRIELWHVVAHHRWSSPSPRRNAMTWKPYNGAPRFLPASHGARVVLLRTTGASLADVARRVGMAPRVVAKRIKRYRQQGLRGLGAKTRPGRPLSFSTRSG